MTTEEILEALQEWSDKPERHVLCLLVETTDNEHNRCNVLLNGNVVRLSANAAGAINNPENSPEGLKKFLEITTRMLQLVSKEEKPSTKEPKNYS